MGQEKRPERKYLNHHMPSWLKTGNLFESYFITVNCKQRGKDQLTNDHVWAVIDESVRKRQSEQTWFCSLLLVMPDHIHGIFRFPEDASMESLIRDWKRWVSRSTGVTFQVGFFDHRLRSVESGIEKREYILRNPIRAGLVNKVEDWQFKIDFKAEMKQFREMDFRDT